MNREKKYFLEEEEDNVQRTETLSDFSSLNLQNAKFLYVRFHFSKPNFTNSNLSNVQTFGNGSTGDCIHGIYKNSNLENMKFGKHCIKTSVFENCNLRNVDFSSIINWGEVTFTDCDFRKAKIDEHTGNELKEYFLYQKHVTIKGECIFKDNVTVHKLVRENEELKKKLEAYEKQKSVICPICSEKEIDSCLIPCGHTMCLPCWLNHFEHLKMGKTCPFCKQNVEKTQKIFIL